MNSSAPVTAPHVTVHDRRVQFAATVIHDLTTPAGVAGARAEALVTRFETAGAAAVHQAVSDYETADFLVAGFELATKQYLDACLRVHEAETSPYGGHFCTACTPGGDSASVEEMVSWPCKILCDAGCTDQAAQQILMRRMRELRDRIRQAQIAVRTELPDLDGFDEYHGIRVGYVGDHGDLYALGWHVNPQHVLTAMDAYARDLGLDGAWDGPRKPSPDDLHRTWARNIGTGTGAEQWCLETVTVPERGTRIEVTCDDPGSFPVTILGA